MPEQWFLKVEGIDGESTSTHHAKAIDIESWTFGVAVTGPPVVGSGAGSGRPTLEPFAFQARMSAATPKLFKACVTGSRHAGGAGFDFVTYTLTEVTVASARHGDGEHGLPFDHFTLGFRKVTITYKPQLPTGAAGKPVTVTYTS